MPYKHNEPRRHHIPKAKYKVANWPAYDRALQQRGSLTVWITPEALEAWTPAKTGKRGRPPAYADLAVETAVMLRLAMGRPWRQTEGLLRSIMQLLGLDLPVPDHTTLARRSARLALTTALKVPNGAVSVIIDSSGLKVFGAGEWQHEKHGGKPHRTWRRLHIAVDPDHGDILAAELTTTDEGDASQVGPLLDQIAAPIRAVLADGAYDGDPVYRTVAERQPDARVIIPPRSTAVPSGTAEVAPTQRDHHIRMIAEKGRLGWQRAVGYGKRSLVETAFYRYKVLIGRSLRARSLSAQKVEARIACAVINRMTSLGRPIFQKVS
ncbi:IS5 family transposase [Azospirillum canadense]|uniref:IS5 family transposase n=1 Tax=Azospirillum canadense TaxID=403962 RepID=UPI0022272170|nr:IS5 family transposase [Azospirillum canadense]MCW2239044.1 transposase [Azospirillum canadense]